MPQDRLRHIMVSIAQVGIAQYIRFAPGTYGALVGAIIGYVLLLGGWAFTLFLIICLFILGCIAGNIAEKVLSQKDPSSVVIDEVVGQLVTLLFIAPPTIYRVLLGFVLFRGFDILKPWPIKKMESSLRGGLAIMADDVLAGVFAGIVSRILLHLLHL